MRLLDLPGKTLCLLFLDRGIEACPFALSAVDMVLKYSDLCPSYLWNMGAFFFFNFISISLCFGGKRIFCNNYRFLGSGKNNWERSLVTFTQFLLIVTFYVTIAQTQNKETDISKIHRPYSTFRFHHFYMHSFVYVCLSVCVYRCMQVYRLM